jgi:hypothetical protein
MPNLSDTQKGIAEAAYTAAGLGSQNNLNVPIGTEIPDDAVSSATSEFGTGIFSFFKKFSTMPAGQEKTQIGENACSYIYNYLDQPYKKIITDAGGSPTDLTNIPVAIVTQNINALQSELTVLEKSYEDRYNDQQTAITRDKILRSGNGTVTNHQVYLLGRPLRPASIPYLWALSTLFIGFALLIFYMYYPYETPDIETILFDLYLLFTDPFTWAILFSIASVVILFLSLRIAKVL